MNKVSRLIGAAWLGVSVTLLLVTVVTVLAQVVTRYIIGMPLPWTEEVSRLSLVCAVYAGTVPAYLRGEHIMVDFFVRLLPKPLMVLYVMLLKAVTVVVVGYIAWGAYLQMHATSHMMLIALPKVSISLIYGLKFLALTSLALVILLTWQRIETYLPQPKEPEVIPNPEVSDNYSEAKESRVP